MTVGLEGVDGSEDFQGFAGPEGLQVRSASHQGRTLPGSRSGRYSSPDVRRSKPGPEKTGLLAAVQTAVTNYFLFPLGGTTQTRRHCFHNGEPGVRIFLGQDI